MESLSVVFLFWDIQFLENWTLSVRGLNIDCENNYVLAVFIELNWRSEIDTDVNVCSCANEC